MSGLAPENLTVSSWRNSTASHRCVEHGCTQKIPSQQKTCVYVMWRGLRAHHRPHGYHNDTRQHRSSSQCAIFCDTNREHALTRWPSGRFVLPRLSEEGLAIDAQRKVAVSPRATIRGYATPMCFHLAKMCVFFIVTSHSLLFVFVHQVLGRSVLVACDCVYRVLHTAPVCCVSHHHHHRRLRGLPLPVATTSTSLATMSTQKLTQTIHPIIIGS